MIEEDGMIEFNKCVCMNAGYWAGCLYSEFLMNSMENRCKITN